MRRLRMLPIALFATVTMVTLFTACGGSPEANEVEEYLEQARPLIDEASALNGTLVDLNNNVDQYSVGQIIDKLDQIGNEYSSIVARFSAIDTPQRGVPLRGYTIDGFDHMRQSMENMNLAMTLLDADYLLVAEDAYERATRSITLASDQWDSLTAFVNEEGGFDIGNILLTLLYIGLALTLAGFVLQIVLGTGCFVIGGIGAGVQALFGKLKGRRGSTENLDDYSRQLEDPGTVMYAGNSRTGVYHRGDCSLLRLTDPVNRVWFGRARDAIDQGYTACQSCLPLPETEPEKRRE